MWGYFKGMLMTVEQKEKILAKKKETVSKILEYNKKIPTGSDLLDIAMEGGWDVGGVAQVYSDSTGGKTLFAIELIYQAMLEYGAKKVKYRYNDAEAGLSFDTEQRYGFPLVGTKNHITEPVVESVKADALLFCNTVDPSKGEVGVYIVDSQDQLYTVDDAKRTEDEVKSYKKTGETTVVGTYGNRAKKLGETWRHLTVPAHKSNVHIFIISQIRDKLNAMPFESKTTVSGGHSAKFTASKRFQLRRVCDLGPTDRPWGYRVCVSLEKTRTKYEKRKVYIDIVTETGFDNVRSNLNFLYDILDEKGKDIPSRMGALEWVKEYDPKLADEASGISNDEYKAFCDEMEITEAIKEEYGRYAVNNIKKYISEHPDVMKVFVERFGVMTFNDMIAYIENNDLEEELTKRVTEKWLYLEEKDKPQNRKERKRIEL